MEGTRKRTATFDTIDTFPKVIKMAEMSKMSASVRAAHFSVKKKSITQETLRGKVFEFRGSAPEAPAAEEVPAPENAPSF